MSVQILTILFIIIVTLHDVNSDLDTLAKFDNDLSNLAAPNDKYIVLLIKKNDDALQRIVNTSNIEYPNELDKILRTSWPVNNKKKRKGGEEEEIKQKKKAARAEAQKKKETTRKLNELTSYLKAHLYFTDYFYSEMQRIIKRGGRIKDELREMVDYLEKHSPERLDVLKCFEYSKAKYRKWKDAWQILKANDLNINVIPIL